MLDWFPMLRRGLTGRLWVSVLFALVTADAIAGAGLTQTQSADALAVEPVAVWAAGPIDVVAAFDRALDPSVADGLVGKTIPYHDPSTPVSDRSAARPLGALRIVGARLTDGGRTLSLATDPHPRMARYVLPLPPPKGDKGANSAVATPPAYDLGGVEVTWSPEGDLDERSRWSGWWPLVDVEATRRLTQGSQPHVVGLALLTKPGELVLNTLVRLPRGKFTASIEASQPILEAALGEVQAERTGPALFAVTDRVVLNVASEGVPLFLSITCRTGGNARPFRLKATYRGPGDKTDHTLGRDELILPWAPYPSPATAAPFVVPDLSGGDAGRGQTIFTGEQARCAQCHAIRGQGGKVGPDLTDVARKSRAEIYRAIAEPSESIEAEYTSYSVATRDGHVVVGVVRAEDADLIRVTDTNAHAVLIPRRELEQIRPSANSIMPVGLTGLLGAAALRDLIAFLTTDPPPSRAGQPAR